MAASAYVGWTTALNHLIARGAHVNTSDYEGVTPLMLACSESHRETALALLEHGASPSAKADDGITALHIVVSDTNLMPVLKKLLLKGADPNATDEDGDTPVHVAASHNMPTMLRLLVKGGGLVNIQNNAGNTPLLEALTEDAEVAAEYLVHISDLTIRTRKGKTALGLALSAKYQDLVITMIQAGCPVSDWQKVLKFSKTSKLSRLETFVQTIVSGKGLTDEANVHNRKGMVRCLANGREWIQTKKTRRHCLKPCLYGRSKTLRCKRKHDE